MDRRPSCSTPAFSTRSPGPPHTDSVGERPACRYSGRSHVAGDGAETLFEGRCEGTLAQSPRGNGGFGYDPAFIPEATGADGRTMAELSTEEKNRISHRGLAARLLNADLAEGAPPEPEAR